MRMLVTAGACVLVSAALLAQQPLGAAARGARPQPRPPA